MFACSRTHLCIGLIFIIGLGLSILLMLNAQVGADQANLLVQGWLFSQGKILPFGNPVSGGGYSPGSLQSILVGLPLLLWQHHHAPIVLIIVFHSIAFILLMQIVSESFGKRACIIFAVLYWLNPWRLYFSGFIWNPNYLFLIGAVHFWSLWKLKDQSRLLPSALLTMSIGLGVGLHSSIIILALTAAWLFLKKAIHIHWGGVLLGAIISLLPLLPWLFLDGQIPINPTEKTGFWGRGLVYVYPLLKGFSYWLRYPSLYISSGFLDLNLPSLFGFSVEYYVKKVFSVLGAVTTLIALIVNIHFCRTVFAKPNQQSDNVKWLNSVVVVSFCSLLIACAISPVTILYWHTIIIFHVSLLPIIWFFSQSNYQKWAYSFTTIFALLTVVLIPLLAIGSSQYSCNNNEVLSKNFQQNYTMIDELHIADECQISRNDADGIELSVFELPDDVFMKLDFKK